MPKPSTLAHDPETGSALPASEDETAESFGDILSQFERLHAHPAEAGPIEGTVIAVSTDSVFVDIGYKMEGMLPLADFQTAGEPVKVGDRFPVSIKGRHAEGYYELSRLKVERPKDWASLEKAFADKAPIAGAVTGVVKGGLSVDVGVRAFMPASRSGAKDA
ncbi:MAG: S1 RNA-binding domain-containing protein, partial [Acidobacteriia bacterium]|nr:S1 RNA-binding domain-containing protein [Terriglobia bacterium]